MLDNQRKIYSLHENERKEKEADEYLSRDQKKCAQVGQSVKNKTRVEQKQKRKEEKTSSVR